MSVPPRTQPPSPTQPCGRGPVEGRTASLGPTGAELVTVEARFEPSERGGTRVLLTGLPDGALRESRARLPAVLASAGLSLPQGELHLNLAPATRPKQGGLPDLGIACTVACALGQIPAPRLRDLLLLGEVDLGGTVHPAAGVLAATLAARSAGLRTVMAPIGSLPFLRLVPGMEVLAVSHLREALDHLRGACSLAAVAPRAPGGSIRGESGRDGRGPAGVEDPGLDEVRGQDLGKRALLVTAAGGHSLLLRGSPGVGKSMLAQRLPGLLPRLTPEEQLELLALADAAAESPGRPSPPARTPPHHELRRPRGRGP
ncbi:MAG: ATP-binding protein [Planctomycetota bacterium]|nr:ATP-binding protein [Planctomycetota bacterium]